MHKVGLVVIFNHKYPQNIKKLESIYRGRFSYIKYLVPFYTESENEDIIPVYEGSYFFHGYISQAYSLFYDESITHWVFIADDLILNPAFNENNILDELTLDENNSYMESFIKLNEAPWVFNRFENAEMAFQSQSVTYLNELPNLEDAIKAANKYGFKGFELRKARSTVEKWPKRIMLNIFRSIFPYKTNYPLVEGYSDFFVICKKDFDEFVRLCGIFAAMNLFVEVAIPTAMMLSCNKIVMQKDIQYRTEKMGHPHQVVTEFINSCNYSIARMGDNWPKDYAYLHPIKLSKWK